MDSIDQKSLLTKSSEIATIAALFVGGGSSLYIIKYYGPNTRIGRAFLLAIRSKFQSPKIKSVRKEDIENIKKKILELEGEEYLVIKGPKGVGKTCMLRTALQKRIGVVYSNKIFPGTLGNEIINNAYKDISGNILTPINHEILAKRVIWWYTFLFRSKPIYVINAVERGAGKPFAEINPAARELSEQGLRIIVDCSDNAIFPERLRQISYDVNPMTDETIKSIREYASLFKFAEKHELIDCILLFCDGNPAEMNNIVKIYNNLSINISEEKVRTKIEEFIVLKIRSTVRQYLEAIKNYPELEKRLEEIVNKDNIELDLNNFIKKFQVIPDFKNIFRELKKNDKMLLIPSTSTMAFVLKEEINLSDISFKNIKEKIAKMKNSKKNEISDRLKIVEQEKNVKI